LAQTTKEEQYRYKTLELIWHTHIATAEIQEVHKSGE